MIRARLSEVIIFTSKTPISERLWSLVNIGNDGDCWEWTGTVNRGKYNRGGYGRVGDGHGRKKYAHRVAYELTKGQIPEGFQVLHQCDNRRCCNPAHLHLGTNADNQREKVERGRAAIKLNAESVRAIRESELTYAELAKIYDVSPGMIGHIVNRRRGGWVHVQ